VLVLLAARAVAEVVEAEAVVDAALRRRRLSFRLIRANFQASGSCRQTAGTDGWCRRPRWFLE
jgi:hypothetical protein